MTARRARAAAPPSGVCVGCGCTDEWGCDAGCSWTDTEHRVCSRCVEICGRLADYLRAFPPPARPARRRARG